MIEGLSNTYLLKNLQTYVEISLHCNQHTCLEYLVLLVNNQELIDTFTNCVRDSFKNYDIYITEEIVNIICNKIGIVGFVNKIIIEDQYNIFMSPMSFSAFKIILDYCVMIEYLNQSTRTPYTIGNIITSIEEIVFKFNEIPTLFDSLVSNDICDPEILKYIYDRTPDKKLYFDDPHFVGYLLSTLCACDYIIYSTCPYLTTAANIGLGIPYLRITLVSTKLLEEFLDQVCTDLVVYGYTLIEDDFNLSLSDNNLAILKKYLPDDHIQNIIKSRLIRVNLINKLNN